MADTKAKKRDKDYWTNRTKYLEERVRQIQEELRDSSTTSKRSETLQTQLKNTQKRILDIRTEHGSVGDQKMKLTATQKYRKEVLKAHISEDPNDPLCTSRPVERDKSFSNSKKESSGAFSSLVGVIKAVISGDLKAAGILLANGLEPRDVVLDARRKMPLADIVKGVKQAARNGFDVNAKPKKRILRT